MKSMSYFYNEIAILKTTTNVMSLKQGTVPFWHRRFGAETFCRRHFGVDTFWHRYNFVPIFGADTFWRQNVLAPLIFSPKVLAPKPSG